MDRSGFSRRGFLKGVAAVGGAAIGTRIAGRHLIGEAQAASSRGVVACGRSQRSGIFGTCRKLIWPSVARVIPSRADARFSMAADWRSS